MLFSPSHALFEDMISKLSDERFHDPREGDQQFLQQYITERRSLTVLFHLMDGRHGPVGEDHTLMRTMAQMPASARYVVVLTKVRGRRLWKAFGGARGGKQRVIRCWCVCRVWEQEA